jgi:hypothetical protein
MRLRIKDVDFDRHMILMRDAKGGKGQVVNDRSFCAASCTQSVGQTTQTNT